LDDDGQRHSAKVAWRALANLQKEIEAERKITKKAKDYKIQPGDAGTEAAYLL